MQANNAHDLFVDLSNSFIFILNILLNIGDNGLLKIAEEMSLGILKKKVKNIKDNNFRREDKESWEERFMENKNGAVEDYFNFEFEEFKDNLNKKGIIQKIKLLLNAYYNDLPEYVLDSFLNFLYQEITSDEAIDSFKATVKNMLGSGYDHACSELLQIFAQKEEFLKQRMEQQMENMRQREMQLHNQNMDLEVAFTINFLETHPGYIAEDDPNYNQRMDEIHRLYLINRQVVNHPEHQIAERDVWNFQSPEHAFNNIKNGIQQYKNNGAAVFFSDAMTILIQNALDATLDIHDPKDVEIDQLLDMHLDND